MSNVRDEDLLSETDIPKDQTIRDVIDHYITLGAINV